MPKILTMSAIEGMVITENIIDARGQMLLKAGTKITERIIPMLISRGINEIDILDRYTLDLSPTDSMRREVLLKVGNLISRYAPNIPEANKSDKMVKVAEAAHMVLNKIVEDDTVISYCTQLKIVDANLLEHSYSCAALGVLLAGALGIGDREMYKVGCAGLLHDIGLLEMPHLINSPYLSSNDRELYNEHTTYGYYLTKENGIDPDISALIYAHHENFDGSGYPKGISSAAIPIGARILGIIESFDTLIRFSDAKIYQAVEFLYGGGDMYFDLSIVTAFLENLSIYPLGSIVKLSNGETGVVVNVRKNVGDRPVVRVFYNSMHRLYSQPKLIDMGMELTLFIEDVLS